MFQAPGIMATIGPTLETPDDIRRAVEAGARWFRLPCGYRQRPHLENARSIRAVAAECREPLQLLLDMPSSRPRTGAMRELSLAIGSRVSIWDPARAAAAPDEAGIPSVPLPGLHRLLGKLDCGQRMWFCDGRLEFQVERINCQSLVARLDRGTIPLQASNSVYLPDTPSAFDMFTAEDKTLLQSFKDEGIVPDWAAFSLVSSPEDVQTGREELRRQFGAEVRVMAKMETAAAVERAEAIVRVADGILVARGDLGPAVDFYRLPEAQEQLVRSARRAGKVVIVATQVLEGYAEMGVPQRCELSDLALIARQRPDAIMLGKETVRSPRPIDCIRFAKNVMTYETERLARSRFEIPPSLGATLGRPYLIAVEGANGTGKTLLCKLLCERLELPKLRGVPADYEHPPLKLRMIRDADWVASAMYFLSGVIEASREAAGVEGDVRVTDRSLWSTLAVHYAHDPQRMEILMPLVEAAAGHVKAPDVTIVLEASPAVLRERVAQKAGHARAFDTAVPLSDEFYGREHEFYQRLAGQWPKVTFISTENREVEAVYRQAEDFVKKSLPCCPC